MARRAINIQFIIIYRLRQAGFTILETLIAGCMASGILTVVFSCYLKLTQAAIIQQNVAQVQQQRLWVYHYFWKQLIHAGFAGRCNLRQLDIVADGEDVWRNGIYGYDRKQLPAFWRHKGVVSDVLQVAYAVNHWLNLTRNLNPAENDAVIKIPRNLFNSKADHYLLVEDDERSESALITKQTLQNRDCRYFHRAATTRLYALRRVSFFIAPSSHNNSNSNNYKITNNLAPLSLYRMIGYGRKEELLRGVSDMQCLFGVLNETASTTTAISNKTGDRFLHYYDASQITIRSLWADVVAVKIKIIWQNHAEPLELVARLRNLDLAS